MRDAPSGDGEGGTAKQSGEWAGGLGRISHVYSRKYSRISLLDASLTLVELYSLFSQSPVEKGYGVFFSVVYRLRLARSARIWILVMALWV